MPVWFWVLLAGLLGAALGSFGQCAITRTKQGRSWISGRSTCDRCGRQLTWHENLPILSYFLQKGKSRCCKQRLSPSYFFGELGTALFSAALVWWLLG